MEPILSSKTENSGLLKKLVETIKQTKDAQNPEDQDSNEVWDYVTYQLLECFLISN